MKRRQLFFSGSLPIRKKRGCHGRDIFGHVQRMRRKDMKSFAFDAIDRNFQGPAIEIAESVKRESGFALLFREIFHKLPEHRRRSKKVGKARKADDCKLINIGDRAGGNVEKGTIDSGNVGGDMVARQFCIARGGIVADEAFHGLKSILSGLVCRISSQS